MFFDLQQIINWKLKNNNQTITEKLNEKCEINNNIIEYKEENSINIIDINNKIYKRTTLEYEMIIDFKESTSTFDLKDKGSYCFDIKTSFEKKDNLIIMKYYLDDEKTIIIEMKG